MFVLWCVIQVVHTINLSLALPRGLCSASQRQATMALNSVSTCVLSWFIIFIPFFSKVCSKMCSLHAILVHWIYYRNALLSNRGETCNGDKNDDDGGDSDSNLVSRLSHPSYWFPTLCIYQYLYLHLSVSLHWVQLANNKKSVMSVPY